MTSTAWILGAGPGIGRATACLCHGHGMTTAVLLQPGAGLDLPRGVAGVSADIFQPETLAAALDELEAAVGLPELMVYNASCGAPGLLLEQPPIGQTLSNAAESLVRCAARVVPAMTARGRGTILVTGGGLAFAPKPDLALPSAVKALQRSLTLSLAEELKPAGIHVATLAVCSFVQPGTAMSPARVAEALWDLHLQPPQAWEAERHLR